jgi:hypothetical protein
MNFLGNWHHSIKRVLIGHSQRMDKCTEPGCAFDCIQRVSTINAKHISQITHFRLLPIMAVVTCLRLINAGIAATPHESIVEILRREIL